MKLFLLVLAMVLPAFAKSHFDWIDGKVVAAGHVSQLGQQFATVTVVLSDPDNSDPRARIQIFVIGTDASTDRSRVDLSVGTSFKGFMTPAPRSIGYVVIRYLDKKGREQGDFHVIVTELGVNDPRLNRDNSN